MGNVKLLEESLAKAIEMEEKGHKFYMESRQKCKNGITKNMFKFLADQETQHIEIIKKFYDSLKEKGGFPSVELNTSARIGDLDLFSKNIKNLKEKINHDDTEKKACEFAMELENIGYEYYEKMLKNSHDEKLSKFLQFLLKEESRHYEIIKDLYAYITDSKNWFMYEEGSFPQG